MGVFSLCPPRGSTDSPENGASRVCEARVASIDAIRTSGERDTHADDARPSRGTSKRAAPRRWARPNRTLVWAELEAKKKKAVRFGRRSGGNEARSRT